MKFLLFNLFLTSVLLQVSIFGNNLLGQSGNKWTKEKIDKLASKCENGHVKSCNALVDLAKTNAFQRVRKQATEKISDPTVLGYIVKNDKDQKIRILAVEKIADPAVLAEIAKNGDDPEIRILAAEKISDPTVLSYIVKNDKDQKIRILAVEKIADPAVLVEIAKNGDDPEIRILAIEKVSDQAVLAGIVKNDKEDRVRKEALKRITDQSLLADFAKNDKDREIQILAVEKVSDQAILAGIVKNDKEDRVRKEALKRITDQSLLADFAKNDKDREIQILAVEKVSDQAILAGIVKNDKEDRVRKEALKRITDQSLLADFAKNDKDGEIRILAIKNITDQIILDNIATSPDNIHNKLNPFVQTWSPNGRVANLEVYSVACDSKGNICLAGFIRDSKSRNVFVQKYNRYGALLWCKSWGGQEDDWANSVAIDESDNIYLAGLSRSFGQGGNDVLFLKYNKDGELLKSITWGGQGIDHANAIALDKHGNIYMAGVTNSFGVGNRKNSEALLLKLNNEGKLLWSKTWGGQEYDEAYDIALDANDNIYLTGETNSFAVSTLPGIGEGTTSDIILLKFDKNGKLLLEKTWGNQRDDQGSSIAIDPDGDIYLAGYHKPYTVGTKGGIRKTTLFAENIVFLKFNKNGALRFSKSWVESQQDNAYATDLLIDRNNQIYILGRASYLLKFEDSGNLLWSKYWKNGLGRDRSRAWTEGLTMDLSGNIFTVGKLGHRKLDPNNGIWEEKKGLFSDVTGKSSTPKGAIRSIQGVITHPSGTDLNLVGDSEKRNSTWVFLSYF